MIGHRKCARCHRVFHKSEMEFIGTMWRCAEKRGCRNHDAATLGHIAQVICGVNEGNHSPFNKAEIAFLKGFAVRMTTKNCPECGKEGG